MTLDRESEISCTDLAKRFERLCDKSDGISGRLQAKVVEGRAMSNRCGAGCRYARQARCHKTVDNCRIQPGGGQ